MLFLKKRYDSGDVGCTVPLHSELAVGTLINILKQAKISSEEFIKAI